MLLVVALALYTRMRAVSLLPIDFDEDDYLSASQYYAEAFRQGDWQAVIDYRFNYEHPPLSKLAYGLVLLRLPEVARIVEPTDPNIPPAATLPQPHLRQTRSLSALFGVLETLAVAVLNPVAGFFLAFNTWHIKYTSQVMLEPLPALTSALAVIFYTFASRRRLDWRNPWLIGSAVMLGLTAASKYMYCVVGIAILVDWWWIERAEKGKVDGAAWRRLVLPVLVWGVLAVLVFFAADPYLWHDPISRLKESVLYHGGYAMSEHVAQAGYVPWQPLVWLIMPVPWHPGVFVLPMDMFVFFLALFGLKRLWEQQRVFALWFGLGLLFLLLWPTKWPQYILMLSAPVCLAAAQGFNAVIGEPAARWFHRFRMPKGIEKESLARVTWRQNLAAFPWLLPGATMLLLITLFPLIYQLAMSLTDMNVMSLKDGISGGLWRAVWQGMTGQVAPVRINFYRPERFSQVRYAGPELILALLFGGAGDLVAFEVLWTVLSISLQLGVGLGLALLLEKPGLMFKRWWRLIFILPWAIPEFAGALMWLQINNPQFGWAALATSNSTPAVKSLLAGLINWQDSPGMTLTLLLVIATWYGFPIMMLAATAGLRMVPVDVYDAADMDGASGWDLFRLVTWPLLLPILAPVLVIRAIFAFNQFYLFYVFSSQNSPVTLSFLSYYFVQQGYYALSAGFNVFVIIVLIIMIAMFNRWSKVSQGVTYA